MQAITLSQAQQNLAGVLAQVVDDAEPVIICTDAGKKVVCLPLEEFNSWQETVYLLASPANAEHLRRSIAETKAGQTEPRELIDP